MFEPAFYSTVISDWGSSILAAQELGPKAKCLVDLGHHAPNVNIEQIVARLHRFGKLGEAPEMIQPEAKVAPAHAAVGRSVMFSGGGSHTHGGAPSLINSVSMKCR